MLDPDVRARVEYNVAFAEHYKHENLHIVKAADLRALLAAVDEADGGVVTAEMREAGALRDTNLDSPSYGSTLISHGEAEEVYVAMRRARLLAGKER